MYTLKINFVGFKSLDDIKEIVLQHESSISYTYDINMCSGEVTVETYNIRVLKRLVDIIESEEFMREH
jgi:ribosomal protein S10